MNIIIPQQKRHRGDVSKPFNNIVSYVQAQDIERDIPQPPLNADIDYELLEDFDLLINYTTDAKEQIKKPSKSEKVIAIRTHKIFKLATAAKEMNAVSARNTRSGDSAYHFILSWPDYEYPSEESIFDAAQHAIKSIGLAEHQYVLAIHIDTDNIHCHVAVNRIHPETFKSRHLEWTAKTLHLSARQSEIKHNWTHDNGIYIVEKNKDGEKRIVLNPKSSQSIANALPHTHSDLGNEVTLPPWHDPESLESWLKTDITKELKKALPKLHDWNALHSWLAQREITLDDTGGGGMRLHATSPETGELLEIPASKGLRLLKRTELEARWGKFVTGAIEPNPYIESYPADRIELDEIEPAPVNITKSSTRDLSHLTPQQLEKGAQNVIRSAPDRGIPPRSLGNQLLHAEPDRSIPPSHRRGSLYELSDSSLAGVGPDGEVLLPHDVRVRMGDGKAREDTAVRREREGDSRSGSSGRSLTRDNSKREERKEQRAAARADLRSRFSQYQRFVRDNDVTYYAQSKGIQSSRSLALKTINSEAKLAKQEVRNNKALSETEKLNATVSITVDSTRKKLQADAEYQAQSKTLRATRQPPLGWRVWLHEQADLGDQAALSALRGIVYQAQRDAKYKSDKEAEDAIDESNIFNDEEKKYRLLMARLLEEEKQEIAIRSADRNLMRPYEADALLSRYVGIQWHVTGNGNVEYSDSKAEHLFTDRGNRVTFDRARVTDEEIQLALIHAQHKFGKQITLTGNDQAFSERMARLADDMGLKVLNPELQEAIKTHRTTKAIPRTETSNDLAPEALATLPTIEAVAIATKTYQEILKEKVLSIDPRAQFVTYNNADANKVYTGPVAASFENQNTTTEGDQQNTGFAQHLGRSVYAIHPIDPPKAHQNSDVEVRYTNEQPIATIAIKKDKGLGR